MSKGRDEVIEKKLDTIIRVLQHLLALELAKSGVTTQAIGKHIHVATATIVKMLKCPSEELLNHMSQL
jgi:hypothetical protein